jgi:CBS domain-containing protein
MLIETILRQKGSSVITVSAEAVLSVAASLMDVNRIGAVVVIDAQDDIVGVLSERDLVRHMARSGAAAPDLKVSYAMTRSIITASGQDDIDACLAQMTDRRIRHLPIVDEGRLVGIISIGDLVKWKIDSVTAEAEAMTAYIKGG